jgi:hypothetical protein
VVDQGASANGSYHNLRHLGREWGQRLAATTPPSFEQLKKLLARTNSTLGIGAAEAFKALPREEATFSWLDGIAKTTSYHARVTTLASAAIVNANRAYLDWS